MQLHIFKAHKQGISENMEQNLIHAKATDNREAPDYCFTKQYETIEIHKSIEGEDLLHQLERGVELAKHGTLKARGRTKQEGRYDFYNSIDYTVTTKHFRTHIEDEQVEEVMKALVKKAMGLRSYDYLNCQVMAIYKRGEITWQEATQAHKEDCNL